MEKKSVTFLRSSVLKSSGFNWSLVTVSVSITQRLLSLMKTVVLAGTKRDMWVQKVKKALCGSSQVYSALRV